MTNLQFQRPLISLCGVYFVLGQGWTNCRRLLELSGGKKKVAWSKVAVRVVTRNDKMLNMFSR